MKPVVHPWAPWNRGDLRKLILRAVKAVSPRFWPRWAPEIAFEADARKSYTAWVRGQTLTLVLPRPKTPSTPLEFLASLGGDPVMSGEDAQAIARVVAKALDPDGKDHICSWARSFRVRRHKPSAQGIGGVP